MVKGQTLLCHNGTVRLGVVAHQHKGILRQIFQPHQLHVGINYPNNPAQKFTKRGFNNRAQFAASFHA